MSNSIILHIVIPCIIASGAAPFFCRLHIASGHIIVAYWRSRCRPADAVRPGPRLLSHLFPPLPTISQNFFTASISIFERTVWECRNAKKNRKTYMTHILGRGNLFLPLPLFRQFGGWIQICNLGTNLPTGAGAGDAYVALNAIADGCSTVSMLLYVDGMGSR